MDGDYSTAVMTSRDACTASVPSGIFIREVKMRNESPPMEDDGHSTVSGIIQWKDHAVLQEFESKLLLMRCEIDELYKSKYSVMASCTAISTSRHLIPK